MKSLCIIVVAHAVVVIALAVSISWNIKQARDCSERGQELYKIGLRDGELFTRGQFLRADLEREMIQDRQTKLGGAGL